MEYKIKLPDRQSWIQTNVAKMHAKAASKPKAKAAAKAAKSSASSWSNQGWDFLNHQLTYLDFPRTKLSIQPQNQSNTFSSKK